MDHPQPLEMSEAECDMDTLRRLKLRQQQQLDPKMSIPQGEAHRNFSITVWTPSTPTPLNTQNSSQVLPIEREREMEFRNNCHAW